MLLTAALSPKLVGTRSRSPGTMVMWPPCITGTCAKSSERSEAAWWSLNPSLLVRTAATQKPKQCRPMRAAFPTNAEAAARSSDRSRAIAASFVRTGQCRVRRFSQSVLVALVAVSDREVEIVLDQETRCGWRDI